MTAITTAELPYRPCVGLMILNAAGDVFMGHRITGMEHNKTHAWQMPQGGIDDGEQPLNAAYRELYEETGIQTVTLLREAPDWFYYDLPPNLIGKALKGKFRGQTQRWFAFRFDGDESEIRVTNPPDGHTAEFSHWEWVPIDQVAERIIPFKRPVYEQVVAAFRDLSVAA